jgi:uncharacterized membrane protein
VSTDTTIRIAKGRFEAFSDGVFAIAITLLVLELPIPKLAVVNETTMIHALLSLWPQLLVYCASFATIGIMWFNHYALFHYARHISYSALVANLLLLLLVAFLPYPTWLLGQYALVPAAVAFYGVTLLAIAIMFGILGYVATVPEGARATVLGYLRSRNSWNTLGPVVDVAGTALAFVSPIGAIALFAAIAVFYLLPGTVRGQLAASARVHGQEA